MKKGNVEVHRYRCHMFNALYTTLAGVETLESPFNGIGSSNVLCGKVLNSFKFPLAVILILSTNAYPL